MIERAWQYVAIAFQGRAHIALGYESWDEYVDARLGDLRLIVPRERRGAVVQSLSRAQMSLRAIAKVLGVDVATVHRALGANGPAGADEAEEPAPIRGRDGKSYPRRRRQHAATTCSICGEVHDESSDECPWDLFAQGLGPRPIRQGVGLEGPGRHQEGADVVVVEEPPEPGEGVGADAHNGSDAVEGGTAQASCGGPYTTVAKSPVTREAPVLYADSNGHYDVFVPATRQNSSGTSWSTGPTAGTSIPIKEFFVAKAD